MTELAYRKVDQWQHLLTEKRTNDSTCLQKSRPMTTLVYRKGHQWQHLLTEKRTNGSTCWQKSGPMAALVDRKADQWQHLLTEKRTNGETCKMQFSAELQRAHVHNLHFLRTAPNHAHFTRRASGMPFNKCIVSISTRSIASLVFARRHTLKIYETSAYTELKFDHDKHLLFQQISTRQHIHLNDTQ